MTGCWTGGGEAEPEAGAAGGGGGSAASLPGEVLGSECAALSRETEGGARDQAGLHLGEASLARGGAGEEGTEARRASEAASAPAVARDVAASGRQ